MSPLRLLSNQRVPLYVSLPIIAACGAAGFLVSTLQPNQTLDGVAQAQRDAVRVSVPVAAPAVEQPPRSNGTPPLAETTPPHEAASLVTPPTTGMNPPAAVT